MTSVYHQRMQQLRHILDEQHLQSLLVAKPENVRYLCGFSGGEGFLLLTGDEAYLFADGRYQQQALQEAPLCRFILVKRCFNHALVEVAGDRGIQEMAFEKDYFTYQQWEQLQKSLRGKLHPVMGFVEKLRMVKDESEIVLLREAGAITASAFRCILGEVHPGQTEQEIAGRLELFLRRQGSGLPAFETIVASGERGALPHGVASEKRVQWGEFITMDLGATHRGYAGDLTRTICLGTVSSKQREIYELVKEAQARGLNAVRAGVRAEEVDLTVRQFFNEAGYGDYFVHSLGHGVGLVVHEEPRLAPGQDAVLEPGMVVTVEPGLYIPGWGGVRIEDTVLVKENGCEILTPVTKDLIVL